MLLGFLVGKVDELLERAAESEGVSKKNLTQKVISQLHAQCSGKDGFVALGIIKRHRPNS